MKTILFFLIAFLLISTNESSSRRRRRQYNFVQQYDNQYGLYGPGGQGWVNNNNNLYPNPNFVWNNNWNWNQGTRYPEWYYSSAKTIHPSIICFLVFGLLFFLFV